jgi:hypothetical protein
VAAGVRVRVGATATDGAGVEAAMAVAAIADAIEAAWLGSLVASVLEPLGLDDPGAAAPILRRPTIATTSADATITIAAPTRSQRAWGMGPS